MRSSAFGAVCSKLPKTSVLRESLVTINRSA
jgi:hypothetical protein